MVIGIDGKPLAQPTPVLVPTHTKGDREHLPCFPFVPRTQDRRRIAAIHTRRDIDDIGIDRVWRDAFGSKIAGFGELIVHRYPCFLPNVPAICAAHIGAQIRQPALDTAENDAGHEPTRSHFDASPDIISGCLRADLRSESTSCNQSQH